MKKTLLLIPIIAVLATGCMTGNQAVPSTKIEGYIAGKPFKFIGPKDVNLEELTIFTSTNGAVTLNIKKLNAANNPDTVAGAYKGQADLVNAGANAFKSGLEAAAAAAAAIPKP